jgi:YD repeat-containing protein
MKKSFSFSLLLLIVQLTICRAQFQAEMPLAKPIPPNAAAMFKVVERPLGSYTGTVPVSIPLCSVTSGSLSADIALNYTSTGGIRVAELPGCVGLGFSLADGGGRITQQIRGKADDEQGILNNPYTERPSTFNCSDMTQVNDYSLNILDLEPDEYFYSFNGRSGKFFLKENGSVIMQGNAGLKITYAFTTSLANLRIERWIITDEGGNKYYFGQNKDSTVSYWLENQSTYSGSTGSTTGSESSKSWYLTEARDMNEENIIKYTYIQSGNTFSSFSGGIMPISLTGLICMGFNTVSDQGTVTTDGTEYVVSRIDGNSGYIIFNLSPDYAYGPEKLYSIQCYDSSGNYQKQYKFNYGTFARGDWKLTSLSEFGLSFTSDTLTHKFTYQELQNLPSPLSANIDYWGFYNGVFNSTFFPDFLYNGGTFKWRNPIHANRNANGGYGFANILTQINYPTGGYRSFTYEGNTALYNDVLTAYSPDPNYTASRTATTTHYSWGGTTIPSMQDTFTVNSADGWTNFTYSLSGIGSSCGTAYTVTIYMTTTRGALSGGVPMGTFTGQATNNINLNNGYYRADVFVTNSPPCTIASCAGSWSESTLSTTTVSTPYGTFYRNVRNAGGVRVKEIDDYDPVTGTVNKTQYKYQLYSTDSTLPSGQLVSPVILMGVENVPSCGCSYLKLYPGCSYPLASEAGSFVVYPEVRTIQNGDGWVDRTFSYAADVPSTSFPQVPSFDESIARGHLTAEKTYTQNAVLIHSKTAVFSYSASQSQPGVRVKPYWQNNYGTVTLYWSEFRPPVPQPQLPEMAGCNTYGPNGQASLLLSTTETVIAPSGSNVVTKSYQYKNYNGYYPVGVETTTINNGQAKQVTYNYPFDTVTHFVFGLSASEQTMKSTLLGNNYLQPLEMIDSLKPASGAGSFLDGSKYLFGYFNTTDIHVSQLRHFSTLIDSTVLNFSGFDTRGNLTEQYKTGDVKNVYLWGYSGRFPVAKITNSSYAAVTALVNMTTINNPSSDAVMRTELDKIRTGLAGSTAQVTYYTYSTLYGMTSATDPTGKTTYYQYDNHGRLQFVKDQNNNIIKRYNYQFNNP